MTNTELENALFAETQAKQALQQEVEQLRSEIESLKKVPLFNRTTHKIVPIEPTIEWQTNIADIQDCVSYETIKNVIAAAPEYQAIEQIPVAVIGNGWQLLYAIPPAPEGDKS